jgi:hypothetical protein
MPGRFLSTRRRFLSVSSGKERHVGFPMPVEPPVGPPLERNRNPSSPGDTRPSPFCERVRFDAPRIAARSRSPFSRAAHPFSCKQLNASRIAVLFGVQIIKRGWSHMAFLPNEVVPAEPDGGYCLPLESREGGCSKPRRPNDASSQRKAGAMRRVERKAIAFGWRGCEGEIGTKTPAAC